MPPEETADLEELEEFSKMFKQKRIKLGKCYYIDLLCVVYWNPVAFLVCGNSLKTFKYF